MKKNYLSKTLSVLFLSLFLSVTSHAQLGTTTFNTATDKSVNYGGTWTDGSNLGTGFGSWVLTKSATNSGFYIGGTGQGDPSFGLYSENSGNFAAAQRNFLSNLKKGEKISVNVGHTVTINGEIFLQLLDDGVPVYTLKFVGGASNWQINDGGADFTISQPYAANTSLAFTFTYNENGTYSYTFGAASGNDFTPNNAISGINGIKFQSTNQGGDQNFGFNNLSIDSKYTITNNSTVASDANITIPYLEVQAGSTVNIGTNSNTTISGDLTVNGNLNINSGSSLIVNGTSTGNVTYNRNLPTSNWYLISSPVSGQAYNDAYVTDNGIASSNDNPTNRGIATYTTASNDWLYLQGGGSGTFNNGQGYSVKRTATGNVSFTGTINTADVSVAVVATDGGEINKGFNLIGNPFTSHLQSNLFLADNTANLVSQTIWVWNGSAYETRVTAQNFVLAPAQGFFIRSSNGTNLNIAESYQSSTGGTFLKSSNTEVKLMMNDGTFDRFAKMYYLDNVTKGFDNGFDGETFGGIENSVDVFTNLLENNEGKKYQIQSLQLAEMETMVIPVGIKAASGKEITFTAEALNLPNDLKVFLEDRVTNTVTRLDEANTSYKITLSEAVNETGRFYLHTKASSVLSTADITLENISVFSTNNGTLRIVGLPSGKSNLKLYNILGKQVMQTTFTSSGAQEISLPKLATGVYFVQLESEAGKLNKKIVLE